MHELRNLVRSPVSSEQLLYFVHCQDQEREQKYTTKNFVEFHNHSPSITVTIYEEMQYPIKDF